MIKKIFIVAFLIILNTQVGYGVERNCSKPLIGIMLNTGDDKSYSIYPWYAIRQNYGQVVAQSGGIPVYIGYDTQNVDDILSNLDGLVLTGGDFATPPEAFTTGIVGPVDPKLYPRTHFEVMLIRTAYEKNIPVLGICAGLQNMNAAMGGVLINNLMEETGTKIQHRNEKRDEVQHRVDINPQSLLFELLNKKSLMVNSNHRAGIKKVAPGFNIGARAEDGVIEAIEDPNKLFFIGVMWHPEFVLSKEESRLWRLFIDAACEYRLS